MLESHPSVVCQSEVFNSDDPDLPFRLTVSSQEILDRWVYRKFDDSVRAAGFVLQIYHPWGLRAFPGIRENPHWADIWQLLEDMPGLKVIHMRRDNGLRRHLSHILARHTGDWHRWKPDLVQQVSHLHTPQIQSPPVTERPAVALDADRLRTDFEEVETLHGRVATRFRNHHYYPVSYEQLCTSPEVEGEALLRFLGLPPAKLTPAVSKVEKRPLQASISNFDALCSTFEDSQWSRYFESEGP